jgi:hypothetical protein
VHAVGRASRAEHVPAHPAVVAAVEHGKQLVAIGTVGALLLPNPRLALALA